MTLPTPAPIDAGVVGSQPVQGNGVAQPPKELGAFDAPVPGKRVNGNTTTAAKPSVSSLVLDTGSGAAVPSKAPVKIPDVPWANPKTVVESTSKIPGEKAVITYVGDGDGANYTDSKGNQIKCRIDTFDAPETAKPKHGKPGQAYGEESKNLLQQLILNKEVTVRISQPAEKGKNFDRSLCQIEIEGKNIDKVMLQEGAAWVYKTFRGNPELMAAEKSARDAKKGLWADPNAVNPEAFRRMQNYGNRRN